MHTVLVLVVLKSHSAIFSTTNTKKHTAMVKGKPKNYLQCTAIVAKKEKINNILLKIILFYYICDDSGSCYLL